MGAASSRTRCPRRFFGRADRIARNAIRWQRLVALLFGLRHLQHLFWSAGERLQLVSDRLRKQLRRLIEP